MPRGQAKEPGIKKLPGVPYRAGEMGPNMPDTDTERGPLCYVPREPINRCMDFGGPSTGRGSLGSPARADFVSKGPNTTASIRDQRVLPENQLDGSMSTGSPVGWPKMSQQKTSPRTAIEDTGNS